MDRNYEASRREYIVSQYRDQASNHVDDDLRLFATPSQAARPQAA